MKFATVLGLFALASFGQAQTTPEEWLDLVPDCAFTCLLNASSGTTCGVTGYECLCKSSSFYDVSKVCIDSSCSANDIQVAKYALSGLCAIYGVTLPA